MGRSSGGAARPGARQERAGPEGTESGTAGDGEMGLQPVALSPELRQAIAAYGREGSLAEEIGALRAVLAQLLATGGADAAALSQSVPRVVNAIVRAQRTQRLLAGDTAGDLSEIMTGILAEMGLGE